MRATRRATAASVERAARQIGHAVLLAACGCASLGTACQDDSRSGMGCDAGEASLLTADAMHADAPADVRQAASDAAGPKDAGLHAGPVVDATTSDAPADAASTGSGRAGVRLANWSPDTASVDFCLAPHDGSGAFTSPPIMATRQRAVADAGISDPGGVCPTAGSACVPCAMGVCFPSVSAYTLVDTGLYDFDVRVIVSGAGCAAGLLADIRLSRPAAGSLSTVALVGRAFPLGNEPSQQLKVFSDDVGPPPPASQSDASPTPRLGLRFVHAAPGFGAADLVETMPPAAKLAAGIPFAQTSPATAGGAMPIDTNGYLSLAPLMQASLSGRLAGDAGAGHDLATAPGPISLAAGSVVTMALIVDPNSPRGNPQGQLVQCLDNAGSVGAYSDCSIISQ